MLQVLQYSCYTMSGEANQSRVQRLADDRMKVGGRVVDFSRSEVRFRDGECCELSERETKLLRYLAGNPGRVISRDEILMRVWGLNSRQIITRVIDMHIAHLREKLRDKNSGLLRTVYGRGYLFMAERN
jgi:DNA-binding response OmpR family regulator